MLIFLRPLEVEMKFSVRLTIHLALRAHFIARIFVSGPLNNGGSSAVLGGRDHVLYPPTCTILPATSLSITDQLRAIIQFC